MESRRMVELLLQVEYHKLIGGGMRSNCCRLFESVICRVESSSRLVECNWCALVEIAGL